MAGLTETTVASTMLTYIPAFRDRAHDCTNLKKMVEYRQLGERRLWPRPVTFVPDFYVRSVGSRSRLRGRDRTRLELKTCLIRFRRRALNVTVKRLTDILTYKLW